MNDRDFTQEVGDYKYYITTTPEGVTQCFRTFPGNPSEQIPPSTLPSNMLASEYKRRIERATSSAISR